MFKDGNASKNEHSQFNQEAIQVESISQNSDRKKRKRMEQAAERACVSVDTVYRCQKIMSSGDADLIQKLDSGELSVNKAYCLLKEREQVDALTDEGKALMVSTEIARLAEAGDEDGSESLCNLLQYRGVHEAFDSLPVKVPFPEKKIGQLFGQLEGQFKLRFSRLGGESHYENCISKLAELMEAVEEWREFQVMNFVLSGYFETESRNNVNQ